MAEERTDRTGTARSPRWVYERRSSDPEVAHAVLTEVYGGHRPTLTSTGRPLDFRLRVYDTGPVGLDLLRHSWRVTSHSEPLRDFLFSRVLGGHLANTSGREHVRLAAGDAIVNPHGAVFDSSWTDLSVALVRLPADFLADYAAAHTGIAAGDFRFHRMMPISAVANRRWWQISGYATAQLGGPSSALDHPLVLAEVARLVAAAALATFPNTTHTEAYPAGPGDCTPAAIRRAVVYVEEHAAEPIALADIAAAARIGPRALQAAFRRHHDTTPMAYLRTVRLERAHRELQAADPADGATVAVIAARWGFARPDRFAASYRRLYGRPPAATLRS